MTSPQFFPRAASFRAWLRRNHSTAVELWVGFYRRGSGRPSITWPESVDEALSYGWIDGIRKSIDDVSYMIRFTARKPTSTWSDVNVAKVKMLIEQGHMSPAEHSAKGERIPQFIGPPKRT